MSCSVLSTNSLSEAGSYGGSPSEKKEKSIQVLNTMMKILSCLNTMTLKQIEKSYKLAVEDKRCKLSDTQKAFLFYQLQKFRSVIKVLYLQEDQTKVLSSPIALVRNIEGGLVLSRWSVDPEDRKENEILSELMKAEGVTSACILELESENVSPFKSDGQKSLNTSIESRNPLKISTESQKSLYKEPRIINQSNPPFLAERVMQSSQPKADYTTGFVSNTQSNYAPLRTWSANAGTSFGMHHQYQPQPQPHYQIQHQPQPQPQPQYQPQYQPRNRRESEQDRDIQRVMQQLGNNRLSTEKLLADYGSITYRKLFEDLLSDPDDETNEKWIGYFRKPFSSSWKDPCLVAVRDHFRIIS